MEIAQEGRRQPGRGAIRRKRDAQVGGQLCQEGVERMVHLLKLGIDAPVLSLLEAHVNAGDSGNVAHVAGKVGKVA